jgi:small subunit ribosomal protein S2
MDPPGLVWPWWLTDRFTRGVAEQFTELRNMASLVKGLIDAGIHYGHRTAGWNPKMEPYIFGKKNGIHIIDVRQTVKGLLLAKKFITRTVANGKDVLFVGTKRQARPALEGACEECDMPYVTERWLGGTLTNFRTIRSRLKRLEELETLMDGEDWDNYSKKMASQLTRERKKIDRNLGGIRKMDRLPGVLVVVDVRREINALREARSLGIPTICLLDTDGDPDMTDIPIPGNDDAMRAIDIIVKELAAAAAEGKTARAQKQKAEAPEGKRRSSRAQFRADEAEAEDEGAVTGLSSPSLAPDPSQISSGPETGGGVVAQHDEPAAEAETETEAEAEAGEPTIESADAEQKAEAAK